MYLLKQLVLKVKNKIAFGIIATNSQLLLRWYHQSHKPVYPSHHHLLDVYQRNNPQPFFVQVGANSARVREPLHRYILLGDWPGIMVEPQPDTFRKLKVSFRRNQQLIFEPSAISDYRGQIPFFYIEQTKGTPYWVNQLSSVKQAIPGRVLDQLPTAKLQKTAVNCLTLDNLLTKHNTKELDLLIIDAEGHDYIVLQSLNWNHHRPDLIFFEHCHLSEADYSAAKQLLLDQGYTLYKEGMNTAAIANLEQFEAYQQLLTT